MKVPTSDFDKFAIEIQVQNLQNYQNAAKCKIRSCNINF